MAGYVLFFPGVNVGNDQVLQRLGLGGLLGDASPEWTDCVGPNGQGGMLAAWRLDPVSAPSLEMVQRNWKELPADASIGREPGAVWLGTEVSRPLIPRDIARRKFLPGEWC